MMDAGDKIFHYKEWAVKSIFSLSIRQYAIESENNIINNGIKNISQLSHLCPFIPVQRLLLQNGKDTLYLK